MWDIDMNCKSTRNKTLFITDKLKKQYLPKCIKVEKKQKNISKIKNKTIVGNSFDVLKRLPDNSVDLVITDPPYNIEKKFNQFERRVLFIGKQRIP